MKPILTLKQVPKARSTNPYGWKKIHFLQFNFDGRGGAIARHDNAKDLHIYGLKDVEAILEGDSRGERWYQPV